MLAFFLAIITTIVASFVTAFINYHLHFNIQAFGIFIILPIGAMAVAALAASGILLARKIQKTPFKSYMMIMAAVFGLISFFSSTYADYHFSIKAIEEKTGIKIHELDAKDQKDFYDKYSFMSYLKFLHDETTITISGRGSKNTKINNSIVSAISFWLSVVGGAAGGYALLVLSVGDRTKDKRNGTYRDLKYDATFDGSEVYEKLAKSLTNSKELVKALQSLISSKQVIKINSKNTSIYSRVVILKSRQFNDGQVLIEHCKNVNNKTTKLAKDSKDLTQEETAQLLTAILAVEPKEKF